VSNQPNEISNKATDKLINIVIMDILKGDEKASYIWNVISEIETRGEKDHLDGLIMSMNF